MPQHFTELLSRAHINLLHNWPHFNLYSKTVKSPPNLFLCEFLMQKSNINIVILNIYSTIYLYVHVDWGYHFGVIFFYYYFPNIDEGSFHQCRRRVATVVSMSQNFCLFVQYPFRTAYDSRSTFLIDEDDLVESLDLLLREWLGWRSR